jgi:hypothetical protein
VFSGRAAFQRLFEMIRNVGSDKDPFTICHAN